MFYILAKSQCHSLNQEIISILIFSCHNMIRVTEAGWNPPLPGSKRTKRLVVLTFKLEDENLNCDHSRESYRAVLFHGTVYHAV